MNIVLLSGGSGKRLWPLSNDVRSKQFIKVFKKEDGTYESMLERMYNNIKKLNSNAVITIATSKSQVSAIKNQLGLDVDLSIEPCSKDTFGAIVLAASYLRDLKKVDLDEVIVFSPVDPYVDDSYFSKLEKLYNVAKDSNCNISLIGIKPTYPSEKYGYIIPESDKEISKVKMFKEKPNMDDALKYIESNALWNAGVFALKVSYILNIAHKLIDFEDYYDLYSKYENLEKISFDSAVVEKEEKIQVIKYDGMWKDLGTWNTLTEAIDDDILGNGILDDNSENTNIINELNIPILCMGVKNAIIAASSDGILITDKRESSYIKPYVEKIDQQVMFTEKSWGSYRVIDIQDESLTILVTLKPHNKMEYHSHDYRDEVWTIVSGSGRTIVDGMEQFVKPGDVVTIGAGCRHTIIADTEIKVIEVQIGKEINVNDKHKYKLED